MELFIKIKLLFKANVKSQSFPDKYLMLQFLPVLSAFCVYSDKF